MHRLAQAAFVAAVLAAPAAAQERPMRQPPPDHWLTFDSLVALVQITDDQKPEVEKHYLELNKVVKKAADERAKFRGQRQAGPPTREQMEAMRATFELLQTDADKHHKAIRKLLSEGQQAAFDSLPPPRVAMRRGPRR